MSDVERMRQGMELLTLLEHGIVTVHYKGEESEHYQEYLRKLLKDAFEILENSPKQIENRNSSNRNPKRKYNLSEAGKKIAGERLRNYWKNARAIPKGSLPCHPNQLAPYGVNLRQAYKYHNKEPMLKTKIAQVEQAVEKWKSVNQPKKEDKPKESNVVKTSARVVRRRRELKVVNGGVIESSE